MIEHTNERKTLIRSKSERINLAYHFSIIITTRRRRIQIDRQQSPLLARLITATGTKMYLLMSAQSLSGIELLIAYRTPEHPPPHNPLRRLHQQRRNSDLATVVFLVNDSIVFVIIVRDSRPAAVASSVSS
ncbi:hypothetical protein LINPERHAP2_LOCUS34790 [Linum perenne]